MYRIQIQVHFHVGHFLAKGNQQLLVPSTLEIATSDRLDLRWQLGFQWHGIGIEIVLQVPRLFHNATVSQCDHFLLLHMYMYLLFETSPGWRGFFKLNFVGATELQCIYYLCRILISRPPRVFRRFKRRSCPKFPSLSKTLATLNITFSFGGHHQSSAVVTRIKYESNSQNSVGIFGKWNNSLTERLPNIICSKFLSCAEFCSSHCCNWCKSKFKSPSNVKSFWGGGGGYKAIFFHSIIFRVFVSWSIY